MGNHVSKEWHLIDATKVHCPAVDPADGTKEHLNSTLLPDNVAAPTEFTYLVTDGSDDGPYLEA